MTRASIWVISNRRLAMLPNPRPCETHEIRTEHSLGEIAGDNFARVGMTIRRWTLRNGMHTESQLFA